MPFLAFLLSLSFASAGDVYTNAKCQDLLTIMFPTHVEASGMTKGYSERLQIPHPQDIDGALAWSGSVQTYTRRDKLTINLSYFPLESPLLWDASFPGAARGLLASNKITELRGVLSEIHDEDLVFSSVLEKALFQRDFYQIIYILMSARESSHFDNDQIDAALVDARAIWDKILFTDSEFGVLVQKMNAYKKETAKGQSLTSPYNRLLQYLPGPAINQYTNWHEIIFNKYASAHFRDYGGRSFIRVYLKMPGFSDSEISAFHKRMNMEYGGAVHLNGSVEAVPDHTEVTLVRTVGLFLKDGSYVDSGIVEEVLLRAFKTGAPKVDQMSTDLRGGYYYQYKMRRDRLLQSHPVNLGLFAIEPSDCSFWGYFGDVPDPISSGNSSLTSLQANCTACHSELHYGTSTIFSLEQPYNAGDNNIGEYQSGLLKRLDSPSRYMLNTDEYTKFISLRK
jgi:hypothetical protein